jgi:septal ring-binding cell division protein DamX
MPEATMPNVPIPRHEPGHSQLAPTGDLRYRAAGDAPQIQEPQAWFRPAGVIPTHTSPEETMASKRKSAKRAPTRKSATRKGATRKAATRKAATRKTATKPKGRKTAATRAAAVAKGLKKKTLQGMDVVIDTGERAWDALKSTTSSMVEGVRERIGPD